METIRTYEVQIKGANSVKELKQEISDLRDKLVQLDSTSMEYESVVNELVKSETQLKTVMSAGKTQTEALEGSYNALVNRMSALKKVWKEVTDESVRADLGRQIKDINDQLKVMDATTGNFQRNVGGYEKAMENAFGETARAKVARLKQELAGLTEGTEAYKSKWSELSDAMTDMKKQQENLAYSTSDLGAILGNTATTIQTLVGGFAVAQGTMALFGNESTEINEKMMKLQAIVTIIKGFEQLESLRDKIPALVSGIKAWASSLFTVSSAEETTAVATDTVTGAQQRQIGSSTEASGAVLNLSAANMEYVAELQKRFLYGEKLTAQEEAALKTMVKYEAELIGIVANTKLANGETQLFATALGDLVKVMKDANGETEVKTYTGAAKEVKCVRELTAEERKYAEQQYRIQQLQSQNVKWYSKAGLELKALIATQKANNATSKASAIGYNLQATALKGLSVAAGLASGAFHVLKGAIISTGIGALMLGIVWAIEKMIEGIQSLLASSNELGSEFSALAQASQMLLDSIDRNNEALDYEARLLQAQGKSYDEIYKEKLKVVDANIKQLSSQLSLNNAKYAGLTAEQKETEVGKKLKESIDDITAALNKELAARQKLIQDKVVHDTEEETKAANAQAEAAKKKAEEAARKAADAAKKSRDDLDKLINEIDNYGKTEIAKLQEERDKKLAVLARMGKDTKGYKEKELKLIEEYNKRIAKVEDDANAKIWDAQKKYRDRSLALYDTNSPDGMIEKLKRQKEIAEEMYSDLANSDGSAESLNRLNHLYGLSMQNVDDLALETKIAFKGIGDAAKELNEKIGKNLVDGTKEVSDAISYETDFLMQKVKAQYDILDSERKNGLTAAEKQKEEDELYEIQRNGILRQMELNKALADDENLTREQQLEAYKNYLKEKMELENLDVEHTVTTNNLKKESWEQTTKHIGDAMKGVADILGNAGDAYESYIEQQVEAGEMSQEEGEKQFEVVKKIQQGEALINAFLSANEAYSALASIPYVGPALGAAAAAAALAAGLMQVRAIENTSLNSSSSSSSYSSGMTIKTAVNPTPIDYNPEGVINLTGLQENRDLANTLSGGIKAYVVESEVTAKQELSQKRENETTY